MDSYETGNPFNAASTAFLTKQILCQMDRERITAKFFAAAGHPPKPVGRTSGVIIADQSIYDLVLELAP
jgi:hypothetical protein